MSNNLLKSVGSMNLMSVQKSQKSQGCLWLAAPLPPAEEDLTEAIWSQKSVEKSAIRASLSSKKVTTKHSAHLCAVSHPLSPPAGALRSQKIAALDV